MSRIQSFSSLLLASDIAYLSAKYDLDYDFVRGMDDVAWCAFLGCEVDELAFYLLEDEDYAETLAIESEQSTLFDDERYEEDNMDALFEDTDLSESIIELNTWRDNNRQSAVKRHPATTSVGQMYRKPAPVKSKKSTKPVSKPLPKKVPHYLEVVF